jgi:hypothetical protein
VGQQAPQFAPAEKQGRLDYTPNDWLLHALAVHFHRILTEVGYSQEDADEGVHQLFLKFELKLRSTIRNAIHNFRPTVASDNRAKDAAEQYYLMLESKLEELRDIVKKDNAIKFCEYFLKTSNIIHKSSA